MIKFTSNIKEVISSLVGRMEALKVADGPTIDKMVRTASFDVLSKVKKRIHVDGLNAQGQNIGSYSNSYIKFRKKNKRGESAKVIFSLTRQMENDFNVVASGNSYGLGFKNEINANKVKWLEKGSKTHLVKEHKRVIGKKSTKNIDKNIESIRKIEEQIAEGNNSSQELLKLNQRLASAKKKYQKSLGKEVQVKAHQRKGTKGFGVVYKLTKEEIEVVKNSMSFFFKNLLEGNQ